MTKIMHRREDVQAAILAYVEPRCEEDASGAPVDGLYEFVATELALPDLSDVEDDALSALIDDLVSDLETSNQIVEDRGSLYLPAVFERSRSEYLDLKARVLSEAERRGFRCKWSEREGWEMRDKDGKFVSFGPMREMAKALGIPA